MPYNNKTTLQDLPGKIAAAAQANGTTLTYADFERMISEGKALLYMAKQFGVQWNTMRLWVRVYKESA